MKKFMFLALAIAFVLGISVSSAIADGPYLKWDVGQDGTFDTNATLKPGETLVVDLYATDIQEPGAAAFKMGDKNDLARGTNYDDNILTCNNVIVDSTVWPQTGLNWTDITQSGEINCGGCGPLGVALLGNHRLISIEFTCDAAGSETFDFTETNEDFYLVKFGIGSLNVDEQTYALTITCEELGANHAPVAKDQSRQTPKNQSLDITLEATDADGDSLTYSIVDNPTHGTLSGTPPNVTYTPDTDYTDSDSFTFKANDGELDSNEATVSITIKEPGGGGFQSITPVPGCINPTPGWDFTFSVRYDVSDGNNELSGIGFYVHYNSRYLEFVEVSNVLEECYGLVDDPEVEDDTEDYDGDPGTDKRFVVFWADFTPPSSWPGVELPLNLMNVTFKVKEEALINTSVNFTGNTAAGYDFVSEPLKICDLDIKANGQDGPITLHSSDTLNITISIDNNGRTENADWWLAVDAPFGIWFYTLEFWTETLLPAYQGPLFYYPYPFKIIRDIPVSWLRAGTYTFYFGVDTFMDGDITWNICYDAVEVNIE